jgi:hypothetical protein
LAFKSPLLVIVLPTGTFRVRLKEVGVGVVVGTGESGVAGIGESVVVGIGDSVSMGVGGNVSITRGVGNSSSIGSMGVTEA